MREEQSGRRLEGRWRKSEEAKQLGEEWGAAREELPDA